MLDQQIRSQIAVAGLLGDGPPFLAQLTIEHDHLDAFGQSHTIAVRAAGCGLDVPTATARCCAEAVERVVAGSPAAVRRRVLERGSAPPCDLLPWWAFSSYGSQLVRRLGDEAPFDGEFVCIAEHLSRDRQVLVPASRVILHWQTFVGPGGVAGECDATGLAAGTSIADAAERGLREVAERDAVMRAWRDPSWSGRAVEPGVLGQPLTRWLAAGTYRVRLADVARLGLDPVVVALLHDDGGATVGTACRSSLGEAAEAAVLEAAMLRSTIDVLGADPAADRVESSLDHVRFGYRHPDILHRWLDGLVRGEASARCDPDGRRVGGPFGEIGGDAYVVVLAEPEEAPFPVVRVLVPGAMRKEWRHEWRSRVGVGTDRDDRSSCHDLPHPFG